MATDQLADATKKLVKALRAHGRAELEFAATLEEAHREGSPKKYRRTTLLSTRIEGLGEAVDNAVAVWIEASGKKGWY